MLDYDKPLISIEDISNYFDYIFSFCNNIFAVVWPIPIFKCFISNVYNGWLYYHISLDSSYKYCLIFICHFTENKASYRKVGWAKTWNILFLLDWVIHHISITCHVQNLRLRKPPIIEFWKFIEALGLASGGQKKIPNTSPHPTTHP